MTATKAPPRNAVTSLWRNLRVRRIAFQVVFFVAFVLFVRYLYTNVVTNLQVSGLPTGFGFLDQPTGYDIGGADFRPSQPIRDALWIGYLNTIRVAGVGIVLATVLGTFIGIARLSANWLVRKVAGIYVEALRNTPVLLTISFMYFAVALSALPGITSATDLLGAMILSTRGIWIPWLEVTAPVGGFLVVIGAGVVAAVGVAVWRTRRFDASGTPHHRVLWAGGLLLAVGSVAYVAFGGPVGVSLPLREGRVVEGGLPLQPAFGALLAGLVLYTSSHVAEIVRGSVLAVPRGQGEAAMALALSGFQRMRFVILPQAFRIAVPPLASQYLNLTKNSSLAIFIGYVEFTRITFTNIGNANPAPQSIVVLGLGYLALSLAIATVTNFVNRTLTLER